MHAFNSPDLFLVKVGSGQEQGNNYCRYYVCEFIMAYAKRTPEEILKVRYINIFIISFIAHIYK